MCGKEQEAVSADDLFEQFGQERKEENVQGWRGYVCVWDSFFVQLQIFFKG